MRAQKGDIFDIAYAVTNDGDRPALKAGITIESSSGALKLVGPAHPGVDIAVPVNERSQHANAADRRGGSRASRDKNLG